MSLDSGVSLECPSLSLAWEMKVWMSIDSEFINPILSNLAPNSDAHSKLVLSLPKYFCSFYIRFLHLPMSFCTFKLQASWFIETRQGKGKIIGFFPTNQITLYMLHWFCSDFEILTVCCRPTIWALIGWGKTTQVAHSLLHFYVLGCT